MKHVHLCPQSSNDARLRPPDEWVNKWRLEMDETSISIRFCPFCGEKLVGDDPREVRGLALEHVESLGIRPGA